MNTPSKEERISRGVYLATMCLAAFSCGAYANARTARSAPAPSHLETASREDGGAGVPALLVLPNSCPGFHVCDGPSCPFPGPNPGEEQHQCVTYYPDQGGSVTMDTRTLGASSCNAPCTILVHEYGQYAVVIEGEQLDRLDREVRLGHIGRVEACSMETADPDGSIGEPRYAVNRVRVIQPTSFHFDSRTAAFVADEN